MIVYRYLPLLVFLILTGCNTPEREIIKDPDLGYITTYEIDKESGLRHGIFTKTDSTGLLMEKGHMFQGQLNGIRELYYPDGKVKTRERYRMDRIDDLFEFYFPSGALQLKGYYVEGEMYGLWITYSKEGAKLEEVNMIHNEENGPFHEYYPDGKLKAEGYYLNGPNEHGRLKLYDESGQLQKEMDCNKGRCYTRWTKE